MGAITEPPEILGGLIGGALAPLFWVGVFLFGIALPVTISVISYFTTASSALMIVAVCSEVIGGLALRFAVLKAGMYTPLLPAE